MKKKIKYLILIVTLLFLTTGCTTYLKDKDKKVITNEKTGQNLVENILCRPTDSETIKLYEENGFDLTNLPYCVCDENIVVKKDTTEEDTDKKEEVKEENKDEKKDDSKKEDVKEEENQETETKEEQESCNALSFFGEKYESLWTNIFVNPLAYIILFFGKITGKFGLGLIITSILIRLAMFPLTKKTTMQSEKMKEIQPELNRLEKKYANKDLNDRNIMMQKSQEQMLLYKKYNFNPLSGCLISFIQLPLLMAFLDAINRVPAIFEENFLGLHLGTTPKIGITNGNWLYIILTVLVAVTTFYSLIKTQNNPTSDDSMAKQTKTMMNAFTIMIIVMSVFMSSALNIYWIVSNGFTLIQNYFVKRSMK